MVTYHAELDPEGAAKLAETLLPPAPKVLADRVASSLQTNVERLP